MANQLTGTVQSGGTDSVLPLGGAVVTVYEAAATGTPTAIGTTISRSDGGFSLDYGSASTDSIYYATAGWGGPVLLATVIGPELAGPITINELTTVAAAYSMAQFAANSAIAGNAFGLRIAAGMSENLASSATGRVSDVLQAPPNADQTIAMRSVLTLGNLLAPCVRQLPGAVDTLLQLATPPGGARPADTFQAMVNIARYPAENVLEIYDQAQVMEIYAPSLTGQPDAWTLAVKVNDTGDRTSDHKRMFGGPGSIVFDSKGYAWIPNNVFQGEPDSGDFVIVLQPNGKPSDGSNGTPVSPITGGGLKGPGLGLGIDSGGNVWVGNFGWGTGDNIPAHGSVSCFAPDGRPLSELPYVGGTLRVQTVAVDGKDNVWLASFGNDSVVVFPHTEPHHAFGYPQYLRGGVNQSPWNPDQEAPGKNTFGIAIDPTEKEVPTAWVTYSGGLGWPHANPGAIARFRMEGHSLKLVFSKQVGAAVKVVAADSQGNAWVASGGDSTVYLVKADQTVTGFTGIGGMDCPWGIAVDGDDDIWVANFGPMGIHEDFTTAGVTKLAGVSSPSGLPAGAALTPGTGYTLPTAGDPVTLYDGSPLYKHGECKSPLMRQTGCSIDQAGNLWVTNNWKPRFGTDFPPGHGNPGGDGIVIFVGIAKPPVLST